MHDPTKVLMGATGSSAKDSSMHSANPATYKAGLAVRLKNNGDISLLKSDGSWLGVSLGRSLSDTSKIAVARTGSEIPLLASDDSEFASLQKDHLLFTAVLVGSDGNDIQITLANTATAGAETVDVTALSIVVGIESGVSTCQQIVDAIEADAEASALITVAIDEGEAASAQAAFTIDNLEGGVDLGSYITVGAKVYINDTTGLADVNDSGRTISDAVYVSGLLSGIQEDGTIANVVLVDMSGGL